MEWIGKYEGGLGVKRGLLGEGGGSGGKGGALYPTIYNTGKIVNIPNTM